ncbi:MAG: hypothetical protein ABJM36_14345 [Algibacter sp.]|uniref:hypothetical protein n=1 Tax=Algibacter sp. TaxID=1872428 RepID=UPI00329A63D2
MPIYSKHNNILVNLLAVAFLCFSCSKTEESFETKTDSFSVDFVKSLGGTNNESAQAITKTIDGGYAILGYTQSLDGDISNKTNKSFDYWILKYDQYNNLEWQKTYGGTGDDRGNDIIQTRDGGYAVIGFSQSNDGDITNSYGAHDFWVLKLTVSGNKLWQKNYGFLGADIGNSIIETHDGSFLLTGVLDVSASNGEGNSKDSSSKFSKIQHAGGDYWAIKINVLGEIEWRNYYGGSFTDTPYDVIQTEDNGFLLVGSSDSNDVDITGNIGTYDFWVVKISETGALLWEKSFGGSQTDEARAIVKSEDGNYIIVGNTRSNDNHVSINKGAADLWAIKISPTGNLIWEQSFGGTSFDVAQSISKTEDNNYIISGNSRSMDGDVTNNYGQNDAWLLKIDTNGKLLWQKTIGGTEIDFAYDAVELNNKSIIVVGDTSSSNFDLSTNHGFSDLLIYKLN